MGKCSLHIARVHHALALHKSQYRLCPLVLCCSPRHAWRARVHQRVHDGRDKPVVDEEVFFHPQLGVTPLQIAGLVSGHPVAQGQILRPRRGADRVGLHKTQFGQRTRQGGGCKQTAGQRVAAQLLQL